MPTYKIRAISPEPPKKYHNERFNSDTYYIAVAVEGYSRAIEVGKRTPDALKVGDTIEGDIIPKPDFAADGFKLASKPFGGGGGYNKPNSYSGGSKPAYTPRDDDAIRAQWAIGQAVHYLASGNAPKANWNVEDYAKSLFAMVDRVKNSKDTPAPKPQDPDDQAVERYKEAVAAEFPGAEQIEPVVPPDFWDN